jgi:hypothetical protein
VCPSRRRLRGGPRGRLFGHQGPATAHANSTRKGDLYVWHEPAADHRGRRYSAIRHKDRMRSTLRSAVVAGRRLTSAYLPLRALRGRRMPSSIGHQNAVMLRVRARAAPVFRLVSVASGSGRPVRGARAGLLWAGRRRERANPACRSKRGYRALAAGLPAFRARAAAECRRPAAISPAEAAMLNPIARAVARDHDRGRRVTGSIKVPTMHPAPIITQTAPGRGLGARCRAAAAAATAATGIGHGAATPAPQPATRPAGTDSGTVMPSGRPGS